MSPEEVLGKHMMRCYLKCKMYIYIYCAVVLFEILQWCSALFCFYIFCFSYLGVTCTTSTEQTEIVNKLNTLRSVQPTASNMMKMVKTNEAEQKMIKDLLLLILPSKSLRLSGLIISPHRKTTNFSCEEFVMNV